MRRRILCLRSATEFLFFSHRRLSHYNRFVLSCFESSQWVTLIVFTLRLVPLGFFPDNVAIEKAGPETVYPAPGVPFGISFHGTAFSEFDLIGFGYAYEQATQTRLARKAFAAAIPKTQLKDVVGRA